MALFKRDDFEARFVQAEPDKDGRLLARGTLKHGMKIGETVHKEFVMHEARAEELFKAEELVPAERPLAFSAALMTQQLDSIGTYDGPVTVKMIATLHQSDYAILRAAQTELALLGEAE